MIQVVPVGLVHPDVGQPPRTIREVLGEIDARGHEPVTLGLHVVDDEHDLGPARHVQVLRRAGRRLDHPDPHLVPPDRGIGRVVLAAEHLEAQLFVEAHGTSMSAGKISILSVAPMPPSSPARRAHASNVPLACGQAVHNR
ncbi:hypothetical protein NMQ01_14405 [Janibacter sp. CX7]|nr:hypothetical protein [Janibacter sp. CX7]UTT65870.1 hypothetical protein NMQ01_14405 [Janibacter sp. CX7]